MRCSRRGVTIIGVLLVITIGALVASTAMHVTDGQRALVEASMRRTRSRALAWSGVQAAMAELASQRDDLLDGAEPALTETWELFDLGGGRRGVVRLLPVGPGGELVASEAAKINVNTASVETLALVPGLDETLAQRIVDRRAERPIESVESLVEIDGITGATIYGAGAVDGADDTSSTDESGLALVHLLTAFSADPNVQLGLGDNGASYRGDRRININTPWSEELGRAIARRYDQGVADAVQELIESDTDFASEGRMVSVMRRAGMEPEQFGEPLDVFCASSDPYTLGRVDVLRAPSPVLKALPGLDEATAGAIVQARDGLDPVSRRTCAWPAVEGIMTPDQLEQCIDSMASRSLQWRVRVEAGIANDGRVANASPGDRRGTAREGAIGGSFRGADAESLDADSLEDRIVLEAVVDVSSQRPRVAYLRDVTNLDLAFGLHRMLRNETSEADVLLDEPGEDDAVSLDDREGLSEDLTLADAPTYDPFDDAPVLDEPIDDEPISDEDTDREPEAAGDTAPVEGGGDAIDEGVDRRIGRWKPGGAP